MNELQRMATMNPYWDPSQGPAYTFPLENIHFSAADEVLLQRFIAAYKAASSRPPIFDREWLHDMPPFAVPFMFTERLKVSDMAASTTYTLINQRVPAGMRGVITDRACWFNGSGFEEGSGVLTWGVRVGDGYAYKQGNIKFSLGPDFGTSLVGQGGILLMQDERLRFQLTTSNDITSLDANGAAIVRLKGWFIPGV